MAGQVRGGECGQRALYRMYCAAHSDAQRRKDQDLAEGGGVRSPLLSLEVAGCRISGKGTQVSGAAPRGPQAGRRRHCDLPPANPWGVFMLYSRSIPVREF